MQFGGYDKLAVALVWMSVVVVLMVAFRFIKFSGLFDGSDDLAAIEGIEFFDHFLSDLALTLIEREDDRAVLCAHIRTLAIELGGVVDGKKDAKQLFVADDIWIILYLDHFSTFGGTSAYLLVSRIWPAASSIPAYDFFDPFDPFKNRL